MSLQKSKDSLPRGLRLLRSRPSRWLTCFRCATEFPKTDWGVSLRLPKARVLRDFWGTPCAAPRGWMGREGGSPASSRVGSSRAPNPPRGERPPPPRGDGQGRWPGLGSVRADGSAGQRSVGGGPGGPGRDRAGRAVATAPGRRTRAGAAARPPEAGRRSGPGGRSPRGGVGRPGRAGVRRRAAGGV